MTIAEMYTEMRDQQLEDMLAGYIEITDYDDESVVSVEMEYTAAK